MRSLGTVISREGRLRKGTRVELKITLGGMKRRLGKILDNRELLFGLSLDRQRRFVQVIVSVTILLNLYTCTVNLIF